MGRRIWKQVTQQGNAPELIVFTWDGDLLQSEERYQGYLPGMAYAPLLKLEMEDPSRSYSTPIAQRQHTLGHLNVVPLRRVSYLFEANSFIPAAKLETRFEAIEQQTGTGQSGYTSYQPSAAELYYFQTDHLGTPLEVADSDGNLVWVGQYRAWGQLERAKDGNGERASTDNPLRFQGQYHDEETGFHYNRFRYYDPAVGRFTTQDPIGLMGGENLYQYAPNPTGWVDPLGLSKCDCVIKSSVLDNPRVGSANKVDQEHAFNDIIDNYSGKAEKFDIDTKGPGGVIDRTSELRQVEGNLNGKEGVFEWVVDNNSVTHRRFIKNGKVTGYPNQVVRNK